MRIDRIQANTRTRMQSRVAHLQVDTPGAARNPLHTAHADQCNPFALLRMNPAFIVTSNSTYYAVHRGLLAALYCPITVNQASRRAFHLPSIECPPNRRVPPQTQTFHFSFAFVARVRLCAFRSPENCPDSGITAAFSPTSSHKTLQSEWKL
ncbi:TPA: hypothetical protein QDA96_001027 [Burkholderia vietnamiensis]|uniref:hypothetical protein n=1 Tax=Burkholderia vietnamiensis TaxID=60552 RepID=UPI0012D98389|nr:hypothetical protein [Burkholderia vietnamiensis]MBR8015728.1 hypothetical protein [Burkholderia vietnamiensis]HDR9005443.1 hypothetical protein [Burkholderia vietnamiensis]HDR9040391.1 hypothetical protein [Burkholderia vietnamiensis]HDR9197796.1 hypothetical protein [Burkholderia vietnamiensis]